MTISDADDSAAGEAAKRTRARSTERGRPGTGRRHKFDKNQRPALAKLQRDQDRMVAELKRGFGTLEEVLGWVAKANVRTLGNLPPEFYAQFRKRLDAQYLTNTQYSSREVNASTSRVYRDDLAVTITSEADRAYREFRESVSEYTDDQTAKIEMFGGAIGFRPALTELENRQKAALKDAVVGFNSRHGIREWERDLQAATFGEWVESPEYPISKSRNSWAYGILQTEFGTVHPARYQFALGEPLAACIRGARALRSKAQEAVKNENDSGDSLDA